MSLKCFNCLHLMNKNFGIFIIILTLGWQRSTSFTIPLSTTTPLPLKPFQINYNKLTEQKQSTLSFTLEARPSTTALSNTILYSANAIKNNDMIKEEVVPKQHMMKSVINLVKLILGAGVFSLPAGVAAIGDNPKALLPAGVLMLFVGALSTYSFILIGRMCDVKKEATTLSQAWEQEVGHDSSWIIALSTFTLTFFISIAYSIILGDIFSSLAKSIGMVGVSRYVSILLVTLCAVNPLCGLKSLAALTPFSMAGIVGLLLTLVFMFVRLMSGSYAPGGSFFSTLPLALQPSFGVLGMKSIASPSSLVLFSLAASSYCCHFGAPSFYNDLHKNTIPRFCFLSISSFSIVLAISLLIMSFGFLTFGGNCGGMILNNYSQLDFGAIFCRFLIAISLIAGYPFLFKAMKESLLDLLRLKGKRLPEALQTRIKPFLLSIITAFALTLDNVGFVVGLNGAIMGTSINYIFPSIMYLKSTTRRIKDGSLTMKPQIRLERYLNKCLVGFGAVTSVAGAAVSVIKSFFPHLLV